jgi:hypothetical protein
VVVVPVLAVAALMGTIEWSPVGCVPRVPWAVRPCARPKIRMCRSKRRQGKCVQAQSSRMSVAGTRKVVCPTVGLGTPASWLRGEGLSCVRPPVGLVRVARVGGLAERVGRLWAQGPPVRSGVVGHALGCVGGEDVIAQSARPWLGLLLHAAASPPVPASGDRSDGWSMGASSFRDESDSSAVGVDRAWS